MNKNSKSARRSLGKAKSAITVIRMRTQPNSTQLTEQKVNLSFGIQPRLSKKPKVSCKEDSGMSLIDQAKWFHGIWYKGN